MLSVWTYLKFCGFVELIIQKDDHSINFYSIDRHSHDTDEKKKEEEVKFKEVGEAYAVLSDQNKRNRYDSGHDIDDLDGHGGFGGRLHP